MPQTPPLIARLQTRTDLLIKSIELFSYHLHLFPHGSPRSAWLRGESGGIGRFQLAKRVLCASIAEREDEGAHYYCGDELDLAHNFIYLDRFAVGRRTVFTVGTLITFAVGL